MTHPAPAIGPDETLDRLSRTLQILQRKNGHRAASDDVMLAWAAARAKPDASRILDLGTGKGTVALLLLRRLAHCQAVGIEAVPVSFDLAVRNATLNGLSHRYDPRFGDLREPSLLETEPPFDLITGAPPFMPLGSGTLPTDTQRAAGRFELRGGIEAYAETAVRHLAPHGSAVFLMDGNGCQRARQAIPAAGLHLRRITAVLPRPQRRPTYWILECSPIFDPTVRIIEDALSMRKDHGPEWSSEYAAIRGELDLA